MAIDLRALRYFSAIAGSGSISRAAEQLHIAQPALSLQIRKMEQLLGVALFVRSPRGVALTDAGARLLLHADDILARVEAAFADVRDSAVQISGPVALGLPQSIAKVLAVPIVEATLSRWPGVSLKIVELNTGYIPEFLVAGRIDLGVTFFAQQRQQRLRYRTLVEEELVLVGPRRSFAGRGDSVRLAELADRPLILPMPMHSLRQLLDRIAKRSDVTLKVISEVNAIPQLLDLAEAGVGCTILSRSSVRDALERGRVSIAGIVDPVCRRPVLLCRSASGPPRPAVDAIESLIVEMSIRLIDDGRWIATATAN